MTSEELKKARVDLDDLTELLQTCDLRLYHNICIGLGIEFNNDNLIYVNLSAPRDKYIEIIKKLAVKPNFHEVLNIKSTEHDNSDIEDE